MTKEKPVLNFEGLYSVNENGEVFSLPRKIWNGKGYFISKKKQIFGSKNQKGYIQVELKNKPILIHRIVAEAFLENTFNKPQVNHINGIKDDNRLVNLEWCTNSENQLHAYKTGLRKYSEKSGRKRRKVSAYKNGKLIKTFSSISDAKKWLKSDTRNISSCCKGKRNSCLGYQWEYTKEGDAK